MPTAKHFFKRQDWQYRRDAGVIPQEFENGQEISYRSSTTLNRVTYMFFSRVSTEESLARLTINYHYYSSYFHTRSRLQNCIRSPYPHTPDSICIKMTKKQTLQARFGSTGLFWVALRSPPSSETLAGEDAFIVTTERVISAAYLLFRGHISTA